MLPAYRTLNLRCRSVTLSMKDAATLNRYPRHCAAALTSSDILRGCRSILSGRRGDGHLQRGEYSSLALGRLRALSELYLYHSPLLGFSSTPTVRACLLTARANLDARAEPRFLVSHPPDKN